MQNELRQKANDLRKEKKFEEALPFFKKLWSDEENRQKWDGWGYALCLKNTKQFKKAIKVCDEVLELDNEFDYIKNTYAWALFEYLSANTDKISNEEFIKKSERILEFVSEEDFIYSKTIFKVLNKLKSNTSYPSKEILKWIEKLDPEKLDKEPTSFKQGKNEIELASEFEQYFMYKTKALYEENKFVECIDVCNIALESIEKFHYNNDIWFKWRIALSMKESGEIHNSLNLLLDIHKTKKDWFIEKEIAEIYFKQGENKKALEFALKGILNFGDIDKKIHLIILLAKILDSNGFKEQSNQTFMLAKSIVESEGWKIKLPENIENPEKNTKDILFELKVIWKKLYFESKEKLTGIITKILPNGKAGFIKADKGNSYYFKTKELTGKKSNFKENTKVMFYLEDSFDFKKNKTVKNAVNICII